MVPSTTSRSVSVSWDTIECIERNREITDYTVVFQEQCGAMIPGEVNVMDRTFTASGLTPHTNYTFRVAAVNINGTGPFLLGLSLFSLKKMVSYLLAIQGTQSNEGAL